jgi:hypothetical protein
MRFKDITFGFAVLWLLGTSIYSCFLLGSLAHELMHKETAREMHAIYVNYDGSGLATADDFTDGEKVHKWIYTKGWLIEATLVGATIASFFCVMEWRRK